ARTDFTGGTHPRSVAAGDFNQDGRADVVAANISSDNASVLLNTCIAVTYTATPTGTLPTAIPTPTLTYTPTECPAPIINPSYIEVPYYGGDYTINVDTGPSCNWVLELDDWLEV